MLRTLGILLLVLIFCLGAALGYFNLTPVKFDYVFGSVELQLVVLLLLVFAFAVILSVLLCGYRMVGLRREVHRLRKRLGAAESELKNLRTAPLKAD
ncbi:MAG TPA: LapA family protein [Nevskiaceae bacterium]|nr:LapA family protein [Nevskiaceae bacterium]